MVVWVDFMVVNIYRLANFLWRKKVPLLPWVLKTVNRVVFGVVIPPSSSIGEDVLFSYEGLGTIVHSRAIIGNGVIISSGVVIGGRSGSEGVPTIGDGVYIGAGAKVLGDIKVGAYASIGANAVVLNDVPEYAVVVGIPGKVVKFNSIGSMPDYRSFSRKRW